MTENAPFWWQVFASVITFFVLLAILIRMCCGLGRWLGRQSAIITQTHKNADDIRTLKIVVIGLIKKLEKKRKV